MGVLLSFMQVILSKKGQFKFHLERHSNVLVHRIFAAKCSTLFVGVFCAYTVLEETVFLFVTSYSQFPSNFKKSCVVRVTSDYITEWIFNVACALFIQKNRCNVC